MIAQIKRLTGLGWRSVATAHLVLIITLPSALSTPMSGKEHVILLHGLGRTNRSMDSMERALSAAGYQVLNVNYPSRAGSIQQLSEMVLGQAVRACEQMGAERIHFVTHSLGGILVRSYLMRHTLTNLGHVVMLGSPNQGSEVVDKLGRLKLFRKVTGPAGAELGTGTHSIPCKLGPPNCSVGVIAGSRSLNWINSLMIPGQDDGKVSVERTKLPGMADHVIVPATHPFLMRNKTAIRQTVEFLKAGRFASATVSERGKNAARRPSPENL